MRASTDRMDVATEEKDKHLELDEWLSQALNDLKQVDQPLNDFFSEYQVSHSVNQSVSQSVT